MNRLDELKQKGYPNLGAEEREEYRRLKSGFAGPAVADFADKPAAQEEQTVEVKKSVLEGLLARVETLEKSNKSFEKQAGLQTQMGVWREVTEKKRVHTATLRKWRKDSESIWMLAVDWILHKDEWSDERMCWEQIYKIKFMKLPLVGEPQYETMMMPLTQFIKIDDREQVKIIERKVKKLVTIVGTVRKRMIDENWETHAGDSVPMTVTKDDATCTVELPDGSRFDIKEDRLNP